MLVSREGRTEEQERPFLFERIIMQYLSALERVLSTYEFELSGRLPGRLLGEHTQTLPGDGYEIRDERPYEYGGDAWRDVDHQMSARMGEWYVRQTYADREVDIWLLLDVRRGMRLGAKASKFSHALHLLLLAFAWSRGAVSQVGAIRLGSDAADLTGLARPTLQGRALAMDTLDWLRKSPVPEESKHRPIAESLRRSFGIIERPSVVFVATDTSSLAVISPLRQLSYRHELTLFSVRDDVDDLTMPVSGWNNLQDADSGRQSSGYISRRKREKEAKRKADEIVNFDDELSGLPLSHVTVNTADIPLEAFVGFARNYRFQERRQSA